MWANSEDAAETFGLTGRFWEEDDALTDTLWNLRLVPGVAEQRGDWSIFHKELESGEVNLDLGRGRLANLSLEWSHGDGWKLSVWVGDDLLEIECEFDQDTRVGGSEGGPMEEPWVVSAVGESSVFSRTPSLALSAFLIAHVAPDEPEEDAESGTLGCSS